MRVVITFAVAALIGLFITASVIHLSYPAAMAPDFILILVICLSLFYHNILGVLGAFALGLLADFASARYVGPNAGGAVVAFAFVGLIANRVYADKVIAVMIIAFLCTLVKTGTELCLLALSLPRFSLPESIVSAMLGEAFFTALFAPLVLRLLRLKQTSAAGSTGTRLQPSSGLRLSAGNG